METYLGNPHGLAVRVPVVVEDLLRSVHVELVDVHRGDIPHVVVANLVLERRQPVLVGLLAHSRRDEQGPLCLPRGDDAVPQWRGSVRVDSARHGRGAVWLVESLNVLRVPVDLLESVQSSPVLVARVAVTPNGGDEDERRVWGISGRAVVPEPSDVRSEKVERVDTGCTGLDTVGSESSSAGVSSAGRSGRGLRGRSGRLGSRRGSSGLGRRRGGVGLESAPTSTFSTCSTHARGRRSSRARCRRRCRSSSRRDRNGNDRAASGSRGRSRSNGRSIGGESRSPSPASVRATLHLPRLCLWLGSGEGVPSRHVLRGLVDGSNMLLVSGEVSSGLDGFSRGDGRREERKDGEEGAELHCVKSCLVE